MAIYHCSTKTVSRSSGRSAVASIAYRTGEKLTNEMTGQTHDFSKKQGVEHTEIISKLKTKINRNTLWNLAEKTETRKDARTAREWVIALPDELDADQRKDLAKAFTKSLVDRYEVVADLAIHAPSKGGNEKNHHAHIMLTTRKAELTEDNELILTTKTNIELSNAKRKSLNMGTTQDEIKQIRETWANLTNHHLKMAGHEQHIDHRSYADQNNGLQATIHEGTKVTQLRRQGINTEISRYNDHVKHQNSIYLSQQQTQHKTTLESGLERANQGFEQWQQQKEAQQLEIQKQLQRELDRKTAPKRGLSL